jgi:hypothetical protein
MIFGAFLVDEDYTLPVAGMFAVAFCGAVYRVLWKGIFLEAVVLAGLLFGYIVGQSGFAHIHLGASIYFGEVGLIACFLIFGMRVAFTKERFIRRDPLSLAICAFMLIGTLRFLVDFSKHWGDWDYEKTVVRDFATIYYAAFFFISANILKQERSRRFLEKVFPVAIVCLLPIIAAGLIYPEIFEKLSFSEESALILPRSDLTGSFLGFGAIYFMLSREGRSHWFLRTATAFFCFAFMMARNSRATFVGFGMGMLLLLVARKPKIVRDLVLFGIIGALILVSAEAMGWRQDEEKMSATFEDKILSIFDVGSRRDYETTTGSSSAGNNHYRTVWWTAVYNETMEINPLFGLGFGYDLAARFIRTYDYTLDPEDFKARSPHSIVFSIFGRMGLAGIASFAVVIFFIIREALRCARAVWKKKAPAMDLAPWCGVVIIFVTSCFGVMLEGPMAAVVFWTLLGLASYRQSLTTEASRDSQPPKAFNPRAWAPARPPLAAAGTR